MAIEEKAAELLPSDGEELILWLGKARSAIYLACEKSVADDMSPKLGQCAGLIHHLLAVNTDQRRENNQLHASNSERIRQLEATKKERDIALASANVRRTSDDASNGEVKAIYQAMAIDDDPHSQDVWMDVSQTAFETMEKRGDCRTRIVYTTPASQARTSAGGDSAVAGWQHLPKKITDEMIVAAFDAHYGKRRMRSCSGPAGITMTVDGRDWTGFQMLKRMWPAMLAAAPPAPIPTVDVVGSLRGRHDIKECACGHMWVGGPDNCPSCNPSLKRSGDVSGSIFNRLRYPNLAISAMADVDWSTFEGPTRNEGWKPDFQELIYTALHHLEGEGDADDDAGEQIIERLLSALRSAPIPTVPNETNERLRSALENLTRVAKRVSHAGAATGSQWSQLAVFIMAAEHALSASSSKEGGL